MLNRKLFNNLLAEGEAIEQVLSTNQINRDPVDFCLDIDGKRYTLATVNVDKREVFVKAYYEEEYRGAEQKFTDELGQTQSHGITDHISFHKNGKVHLTSKRYKGRTHRETAAHVEAGVFDLPDREVVPFLFLSFLLNDNEYRLPLKETRDSYHVWRLLKKIDVGLIFYVLHKKYISSFFARDGHKFVITPDNAACILNGINDKVIMVILTDKVIYPPADGAERVERHWEGIIARNFLNISVYPQWARLQELVES
jgi:hypothetical protein